MRSVKPGLPTVADMSLHRPSRRAWPVPTLVVTSAVLAACGATVTTAPPSATPSRGTGSSSGTTAGSQAPVAVESNPPGDIPDTTAYVLYQDAARRFHFRHPEGWAQVITADGVRFTDKLNSVQVSARPGAQPSVASVRTKEVAALRATNPAFELRSISHVTLPAGSGVLITYRRNSPPDPVTGRQYRDEVLRYEVAIGPEVVVMELSAPAGSDNADPYRVITTSLGRA